MKQFFLGPLVFLILVSRWDGTERKFGQEIKHTDGCPISCEPCEKTTQKALEYLISTQKEEGYWEVKWSPASSVLGPAATASLNSLALWASGSTTQKGPYQKSLVKARDWLVKELSSKLEKLQAKAGYEVVCSALCIYFLCELFALEKSDDVKKILEDFRSYLVKVQTKDGGWTYTSGRGGMPFMTTPVASALISLKSAGLEIEEEVFKKARDHYGKLQNVDGGLRYYFTKQNYKPEVVALHNRSEAGRTGGAIWAMSLLGMQKTDTFQKARKFFEENFSMTPYSVHGPVYHLFFAALGAQVLTKSFREKFWHAFRDEFIKGQNEHGSIAMRVEPWKTEELLEKVKTDGADSILKIPKAHAPIDEDKKWYFGRAYATSLYALVLQFPKNNLILSSLKPIQ